MRLLFNLFLFLLLLAQCNPQPEPKNPDKKISSRKIIFTPRAPKPVGPYSQGILTNNTLYIAGQIGVDPNTGTLDTTDFEKEAYQAFRNIINVLEAAGMNARHVVSVRVYLTDLSAYKALNEIYSDFFTGDFPARETVQVCALPKGATVEISAIACK